MEKEYKNIGLTNSQYEDIFNVVINCEENTDTLKSDQKEVKLNENYSPKLKLSTKRNRQCDENSDFVESQPGLRDTKVVQTNRNSDFKREELKLCPANFKTDNSTSNKKKAERLKISETLFQHDSATDLTNGNMNEYGLDTWVQCSNKACSKWRRLSNASGTSGIIDEWTCEMNMDTKYNSCSIPEEEYNSDSDVETDFKPGFLVWAKQFGYPWWPGMIENDPVTTDYFLASEKRIVMKYHVTFLDDGSSRSWIPTCYIKPFEGFVENMFSTKGKNGRDFKKRIAYAVIKANRAMKMSVQKRLDEFGFSKTYKKDAKVEYNDTNSSQDSEGELSRKRTSMKMNQKTKLLKKADKDSTEKQEPCKPPPLKRKKALDKSSRDDIQNKQQRKPTCIKAKSFKENDGGQEALDSIADQKHVEDAKDTMKNVDIILIKTAEEMSKNMKEINSGKQKKSDTLKKKEISADLKKGIKEETSRGKRNKFNIPRAQETSVDTKSVLSKLANEAPEGVEVAKKSDKTEDTRTKTSAHMTKPRLSINFQLPVSNPKHSTNAIKTRDSIKNRDKETTTIAKNDQLDVFVPQLDKQVKKHYIYSQPTVHDREVPNISDSTNALESNQSNSEYVNNSDFTSDTKLIKRNSYETSVVTDEKNKMLNVNDKIQTTSECATELGEEPLGNVAKVPIRDNLEEHAFNNESSDFEFNMMDSYTENESPHVMASSPRGSPLFQFEE